MQKKPLLVISFYTNDDYFQESKKLEKSLNKFNIKYKIMPLPNLSDWASNCRQKPKFILDMLMEYGENNDILYLDSDCILLADPVIFNSSFFDIALHKREGIPQPQSGTIFLKKNSSTIKFLKVWNQLSSVDTQLADQDFLGEALQIVSIKIQNLPPEYCCIFDLTRKDFPLIRPVIEHFQASRRFKSNVSNSNLSINPLLASGVNSDVTFTSMIRIDSEDRLKNFEIVIKFLRKYFPSSKLLFCEEDKEPKVPSLNLLEDSEYFYIKNSSNLYHHRTRNMNELARNATTPIIVSYDVDAVVHPIAMHTAIDDVRTGKCDVCNPYTSLRHLDQDERKKFSKHLIVKNISKYRPYTASWKNIIEDFSDVVDLTAFVDQLADEATGLVIVHEKDNYFRLGGANENLLGHASEEMERYVRFVKLGATWNRIEAPAYHMSHTRVQNDYIRNKHYNNNMNEIYRVLSASRESLSQDVTTWSWCNINKP